MTKKLIEDFYDKLVAALPEYDIFLNDDGTKMRNPAQREEGADITCVEDALSQKGVALIVGARLTSRETKGSSGHSTLRLIKLPIEIRTQDSGGTLKPPAVLEIIDELEQAVVKMQQNLSNISSWSLEEAAEYENRPGWGFLVVGKLYTVLK